MMRPSKLAGFLVLLFFPFPALAQTEAHPAERSRRTAGPQDFGVGNINVLQIPAASFRPRVSSGTWEIRGPSVPADTGYLYSTGPGEFLAGAELPQGALIDALVLYYDDPSPTSGVSANLYGLTGYDGASTGSALIATAQSSGSSGKGYQTTAVTHTVNTSIFLGGSQYIVQVSTSDTGFRGVEIWWERQMSPAPATATFSDVPTTDSFFRAIEAFSASGITSGCGGGNFCPNQPVTRQEVAKFFARALGLSYNNNIF
jgi:hypothetical protein